MLRSAAVRVLDDRDLPAVAALLAVDPVAAVMASARVETAGLDPWRLGAQMWGHHGPKGLDAVCLAGANLVPVAAGPEALRAFAQRAKRTGRRCSSIVGPAEMVLGLWAALESGWGPARDVRPRQPLLALSGPPEVDGDPAVRVVRPDELDIVLPAAVAMYTEEIGISPEGLDGGALYRSRVAELIEAGRFFARVEDGRVLFKAEIGAASSAACQVQGVWVDPALRGSGLGTAGTAAVATLARARVSPLVSLYVNEHNAAARAAYARVGFREVGTFASVLF